MDLDRFSDQIHRLEQAYDWQISEQVTRFWWTELRHRAFTDRDVEKAIDRLIFKGGIRWVSLGDLHQACREECVKRLEEESRRQKAEEDRHRHATADELLGGGAKHPDPFVRECVQATLAFLRHEKGTETREAWEARMAEIHERHSEPYRR